jgi:hypothetical protein
MRMKFSVHTGACIECGKVCIDFFARVVHTKLATCPLLNPPNWTRG